MEYVCKIWAHKCTTSAHSSWYYYYSTAISNDSTFQLSSILSSSCPPKMYSLTVKPNVYIFFAWYADANETLPTGHRWKCFGRDAVFTQICWLSHKKLFHFFCPSISFNSWLHCSWFWSERVFDGPLGSWIKLYLSYLYAEINLSSFLWSFL